MLKNPLAIIILSEKETKADEDIIMNISGEYRPSPMQPQQPKAASSDSSITGSIKDNIGDLINSEIYGDKIDIDLSHESYKDISMKDAAKTLGYFTQKMESEGFPWELYKPEDKGIKHKKQISEMEALNRLKKGEEVIFQPMRSLNLSLDSDNLSAISSIGGESMQPIGDVAGKAEAANVSGKMGIDVKNGEPITIKSFGEMKLLSELYNPDIKPAEDDSVGQAANALSFFTKTTQGSSRPWRFVSAENSNSVIRTIKNVITKAVPGAIAGAVAGLMIGGPIGLVAGATGIVTTSLIYGAGAGTAITAANAIKKSAKGQEMSSYKALENVINGKPVILQEQKAKSISLPIVGNLTWYTDSGKGSVVTGLEELELFTTMQNQE